MLFVGKSATVYLRLSVVSGGTVVQSQIDLIASTLSDALLFLEGLKIIRMPFKKNVVSVKNIFHF